MNGSASWNINSRLERDEEIVCTTEMANDGNEFSNIQLGDLRVWGKQQPATSASQNARSAARDAGIENNGMGIFDSGLHRVGCVRDLELPNSKEC